MPCKSVFFGIPAADHRLDVDTMMSIFGCLGEIANRKMEIIIDPATGNNGIHMARNYLLRRFLDSGCDTLFFLDSDIGCNQGDIFKLIDRELDIVLGLYRMRHPVEQYTYLTHPDKPFEQDERGLIPVKAGPIGFSCIKRHVFEELLKEGSGVEWLNEPLRPQFALPLLFDFNTTEGRYAGEDIGFFLKAGRAGFDVWIEPDVTLHHIGSMTFTSNFLHSYRTKQARLHDNDGNIIVRNPLTGPPPTPEQMGRGFIEQHEAVR